jgi:CRISPR-associated protein Csc2
MSILETLKPEFHAAFPRLASGKYVHFMMVRYSQSFPVFQTDGVLNTARTQAGLNPDDENSKRFISRLVMFKRKQVTPERLAGRVLLRSAGFTSATEGDDNFCEYNSQKSCKKCPDCILYGFAVGDSGAERSKVYSDSAFSLSPYDETSRRSFTFNAPFEGGTMSEKGEMRSAINELEHILPEVAFPTIESLRDPTMEGFIYVLGNLMRTRRYGAQESRTGAMANHIIGIVLCDSEIFSNLHFTQALYDALEGNLSPPISDLRGVAATVAQEQLEKEPVLKRQMIFGNRLEELLAEVGSIYQNETRLKQAITVLCQQTQTYAETYGAIASKKAKKSSS